MTLEEMKNINPVTVNPDTLVDIATVEVDRSLSRAEQMKQFLKQIKTESLLRLLMPTPVRPSRIAWNITSGKEAKQTTTDYKFKIRCSKFKIGHRHLFTTVLSSNQG